MYGSIYLCNDTKKTYYFRIRAYKSTGNGTVYSKWSSAKSVKVTN